MQISGSNLIWGYFSAFGIETPKRETSTMKVSQTNSIHCIHHPPPHRRPHPHRHPHPHHHNPKQSTGREGEKRKTHPQTWTNPHVPNSSDHKRASHLKPTERDPY